MQLVQIFDALFYVFNIFIRFNPLVFGFFKAINALIKEFRGPCQKTTPWIDFIFRPQEQWNPVIKIAHRRIRIGSNGALEVFVGRAKFLFLQVIVA